VPKIVVIEPCMSRLYQVKVGTFLRHGVNDRHTLIPSTWRCC